MDIKREIKSIKHIPNSDNSNTVACFITLNKKDMSGVQVYKPRYYGEFDLVYSPSAVYTDD